MQYYITHHRSKMERADDIIIGQNRTILNLTHMFKHTQAELTSEDTPRKI